MGGAPNVNSLAFRCLQEALDSLEGCGDKSVLGKGIWECRMTCIADLEASSGVECVASAIGDCLAILDEPEQRGSRKRARSWGD